eukprot:4136405-Alexandrium_andersonii.AAC.1
MHSAPRRDVWAPSPEAQEKARLVRAELQRLSAFRKQLVQADTLPDVVADVDRHIEARRAELATLKPISASVRILAEKW